jgi:hypothetical protein
MAKPESDHQALGDLRAFTTAPLLFILPILALWWCIWKATDWLHKPNNGVVLFRTLLALILIGLLWTQYGR